MARRLNLTWDEVDGLMFRAFERGRARLDGSAPTRIRAAVVVLAMDMWPTYMDAAAKWLPNVRVCFDRFNVAWNFGGAVNTRRKQEHRRLRTEGDGTLTGAKHLRLDSPP